jgi:hypothetical protein
VDDNVSGFAEQGCGVGDDGHAPGGIRRANNFAKIAAGFCGVFINCADYFDGAFFAKQADDGGSDGSDSILNGANFLFLQSISTLFSEKNSAARAGIMQAQLADESYDCGAKINDSGAAFNTCSMRMCLRMCWRTAAACRRITQAQ